MFGYLFIYLLNSDAQTCLGNVETGRPRIQKDLNQPQAAEWVPSLTQRFSEGDPYTAASALLGNLLKDARASYRTT